MLKSISVSKDVLNGCILKGTEMLIIMYSFVSIQVVRMSTIIVWFGLSIGFRLYDFQL